MATVSESRPQMPARRSAFTTFVIRLFREKPLGAAGAVIFILFLFCGLADILAPCGMNQISPINRLKPPSWRYPFGTDNLRRDMLALPLRRQPPSSLVSARQACDARSVVLPAS